MPSPPARRIARTLAATALAIALLLLVAEGLARALFTERPVNWVLHPFIGRVRPANVSLHKISFEDGTPFDYRTNVLGMRGRSIESAKKPAGTYRIFFVGGSTTENAYTPEERTFPALVEKALVEKQNGNPRVEVANAGVGGANSSAGLAEVSQRILALEPDLVVSLEGNDFFDALREGWDPTGFALARRQRVRFLDWVHDNSRFVAFLDSFAALGIDDDMRPAMKRRTEKRRSRPVADPPEETLVRGVPAFERNLRGIGALCREVGVPVVFMTTAFLYKPAQPADEDAAIWLTDIDRWNLATGTARRGVDAYNEAVRRAAHEPGARLVDLDALVPRDRTALVDDVHLTTRGNVLVADAIVKELVRDGSLPARTK